MPGNSNYIERFENYLKYEKRYSDHTIKAYLKDVNQVYLSFQVATMLLSWL